MKLKHIVCALIISLGAVCPAYAGPVEAKADARALVEAGAEAVGEWAQVRIPAASIRTEGRHAAEMSTQAVLGTPLKVLERGGEWWRVQTPDGYTGWIPSSSVVAKTAAEMAGWRSAERLVATDPWQFRVYRKPGGGCFDVVTDLVNGCIVEKISGEPTGNYYKVRLPDGREGYAKAESLTPVKDWAAQQFDPQLILAVASSMEGTPYLWGGTSTKALDCSGLAKVSYLANGIILMRDASQHSMEAVNPVELAVVAEQEFQYGAEAFEAHQKETEKALTNDKATKTVPVKSGKSR